MDIGVDRMTVEASDEFPSDEFSNPLQDDALVTLREAEKRYIERVLRAVRGKQRRAATILGISRWSLARRLRKFGLHPRTAAGAPAEDVRAD